MTELGGRGTNQIVKKIENPMYITSLGGVQVIGPFKNNYQQIFQPFDKFVQ